MRNWWRRCRGLFGRTRNNSRNDSCWRWRRWCHCRLHPRHWHGKSHRESHRSQELPLYHLCLLHQHLLLHHQLLMILSLLLLLLLLLLFLLFQLLFTLLLFSLLCLSLKLSFLFLLSTQMVQNRHMLHFVWRGFFCFLCHLCVLTFGNMSGWSLIRGLGICDLLRLWRRWKRLLRLPRSSCLLRWRDCGSLLPWLRQSGQFGLRMFSA